MTRGNELYDVRLSVHHETHKAWRVSDDGDDERAVWLPKSQAEAYPETAKTVDGKRTMEFSVPVWLATEKGLI